MEACPTHGTDWLAFKCRFCCSTAVWHCWNKVHFCDPCHNNWSNLVEYNSGTNKKRAWEYSNCASLDKKCKAIAANASFGSDDERDKACAKMVSDVTTCPLKVRHPPGGIEFGIGCGLCRGVETKSAPAAASPAAAAAAADGGDAVDDEKAEAERERIAAEAEAERERLVAEEAEREVCLTSRCYRVFC